MEPVRGCDWYADLAALTACHSTPGDEDEVARHLAAAWQAAGWTTCSHGRAGISACLPRGRGRRRRRLLVCAHMDSPGFCIEAIGRERTAVIPLGKPTIAGPSAEVVLRLRDDRLWLVLQREESEVGPATYWVPTVPGALPGDRLCFHGALSRAEDGGISGPFLDNRLGCAVLCEMARRLASARLELDVVLGATACEEMGGYGAPVLARALAPDSVVCLDATYVSPAQGVLLGAGPVLTLSDASVLLGCRERDAVLAFAQAVGVRLQTEVYNYSGTDARAFPHAGLSARVYPLLLPTTGNHTPSECAHSADVEGLLTLLSALCEGSAWRSFRTLDF
jgi:putative aminopeptidase FrvX